MKQLPLGVQLRADAVFGSFAPGANHELIAALRAPGSNPLWLWGAMGTGKTHLLQAVCAASGGATAYLPLHGDNALPAKALAGFEACRVVCLDDVGSVAGDLSWEQALFLLFNEAAELGTRLIFAASGPPRQFSWCLEDWRSRAAACVVYQIQELDEAGSIEALRLGAAQRGMQLPPETAEYLLRRMPRDLTSLFHLLDRLDEASLAAQRRLTVPFIRDALQTLGETKP